MSSRGLAVIAGLVSTMGIAASAAIADPLMAGVGLIPNTTIKYYDVTGEDVGEINSSIRAQRPTGTNGRTVPSSVDWAVTTSFERKTVDGVCEITAAKANFQAHIELPRLVGGRNLNKSERERWNDYVGLLQEGSLATLALVYQNLGAVEDTIVTAGCENAKAAGEAAINLLRSRADAIAAERERRLIRTNEMLSAFRPTKLKNAKMVCRDLKPTGSRLTSVEICLPESEWARLHTDSSQLTHELQDQSISWKYF